MYIVNQDRNVLINIDNMLGVYVKGNEICTGENVGLVTLGRYETKDRAKEVFTELLRSHFPAQFSMYDGVTNREVYYMPEE